MSYSVYFIRPYMVWNHWICLTWLRGFGFGSLRSAGTGCSVIPWWRCLKLLFWKPLSRPPYHIRGAPMKICMKSKLKTLCLLLKNRLLLTWESFQRTRLKSDLTNQAAADSNGVKCVVVPPQNNTPSGRSCAQTAIGLFGPKCTLWLPTICWSDVSVAGVMIVIPLEK